jgi:hypothetical protein
VGVWSALREFAWAYRACDDRDWLVCECCAWRCPDDAHAYPRCPICQGELAYRPRRPVALELARLSLREALLPIRYYDYPDGTYVHDPGAYIRETVAFRNLTLRQRLVPDPFERETA